MPMTNSKRLTRTTMGSALERHTAGREALAVQETARELAAASVSASTRRAYEGALRRLQDWLDGRILDDATLAEYLAARFEAVHSPAVARPGCRRRPVLREARGPVVPRSRRGSKLRYGP